MNLRGIYLLSKVTVKLRKPWTSDLVTSASCVLLPWCIEKNNLVTGKLQLARHNQEEKLPYRTGGFEPFMSELLVLRLGYLGKQCTPYFGTYWLITWSFFWREEEILNQHKEIGRSLQMKIESLEQEKENAPTGIRYSKH